MTAISVMLGANCNVKNMVFGFEPGSFVSNPWISVVVGIGVGMLI